MVPALEKGSLLGGRYELRDAPGDLHEEQSVVVAGWDRVLERDVAVRICAAPGRGEERARFLRDAKILARVQSPHVVGIYDVGPHGDGPSPAFLVMEPIEGQTLRARLDSGGAFPVARAIAVAREIAAGLVAVHGAGLVHGRVTTSSILFTKNADGTESPKLLDAGGGVDARQDLSALGAVLFEMLEASPPSVLVAHPSDPLASLSGRIPRAVVDVVRRCFSTTPGEQFDSARAVERALSDAASRHEARATDEAFPELVLDAPSPIDERAERVDAVHGVPPPKVPSSMYDGPPELALAAQAPLDLSLDLDGVVREAPMGRALTEEAATARGAGPFAVEGLGEIAVAPSAAAPAGALPEVASPMPSPIVPVEPAPPALARAEGGSSSSSPFAVLPAHVHMRLGVGALILGAMAFAFTQSLLVLAFFLAISLFGTVGYFVRRRADGLD